MFNKLLLIAITTLFVISCGNDDSNYSENNDDAYDESINTSDSENGDDQDEMASPDIEGNYALSISDGYLGNTIKGEAAISSVLSDNDGIKSSGFAIYLTNDDEQQSPVEIINITLLRIGDDTRQLQVGSYPLIYGEADKDVKQYGSLSIISSDIDTTKNISFVEGALNVEAVDELEYKINDAVSMHHDTAVASLSVTMHDKAKAKNFNISGDMRVVSIGKMKTK